MPKVYPSFIFLMSLIAGAQRPVPLTAQSAPATTPAFATGITAATMRFSGGRTDDGLSVALLFSPKAWLTFSASPGFGHTSLGHTSASGLTDTPLGVGAFHSISDLPWSPAISGSLYTTVSLSSGSNAVGLGRNTVGASTSLGGWATDRLHLSLGASRPLSANSGNGSIDVESFYAIGKETANIGFTTEVGRADSGAVLSRSIAGGIAFSVAAPLTFTIDASHGLTTGAPNWSLSAGFGTAFAGVSPLNPTSPLRRLKRVFGSTVTSSSGYSKRGAAGGGCKRAGTC